MHGLRVKHAVDSSGMHGLPHRKLVGGADVTAPALCRIGYSNTVHRTLVGGADVTAYFSRGR